MEERNREACVFYPFFEIFLSLLIKHPRRFALMCPHYLQGIDQLEPLERVQKLLEIQWGVLDTEMVLLIPVFALMFNL